MYGKFISTISNVISIYLSGDCQATRSSPGLLLCLADRSDCKYCKARSGMSQAKQHNTRDVLFRAYTISRADMDELVIGFADR